MGKARWICIFAFLWLGLPQPLRPQDQKGVDHIERPVNALVILERFGGFAGVHERFEVYVDGRVINTAGMKRQAPASRLDSIRRDITALDAATPPPTDSRSELSLYCFDCFKYRITVFSPQGRKLTIAMDELEMGVDTQTSTLARSIRDLVFGLKWD